jgi:LPXTG-motif cell wall-anchored protein
MTGNTISYPAITIPAGSQVSKTFRVRVKFHLDSTQSFVLQNTYGNTIRITIPGTTHFVAPKTGSSGASAATFAGLVTAGFVLWKKRQGLMQFILARS